MPEDKQIQELIRGFENLATEWAFAKYIGNKKNTAFNAWRDLIEYFRKALKAQEKATEQRCVKEIEEWIFLEHDHHEEGSACFDEDYPYVNSLKLEKFINSITNKK